MEDEQLLSGLTVVDMSQFLSGPYCSLRLLDLGARVIKIERPDGGDLCRRLYLSDTDIDGDSTLFHAINRGKESYSVDLKSEEELARLRRLLAKADVVIQNFRPGVIERLGLHYEAVRAINPSIVYASISGYGESGPWVGRPGQDLLAQARSGLMWLNGDEHQGPVPFGLAIGDMLAGANACQGILAALVRRGISGKGAHIQTSLLESLVDLQFEVLTTHLNDGGRRPKRSSLRSAHAYLAAPYGVYPAKDGYIAIAMMPIGKLQDALLLEALGAHRNDLRAGFTQRDEIKQIIADHIATQTVDYWLRLLEPADIWCARVLEWPELLESEGFKILEMLQIVSRDDSQPIGTTRCPIRIDGTRPSSRRAAPRIGEDNDRITEELFR